MSWSAVLKNQSIQITWLPIQARQNRESESSRDTGSGDPHTPINDQNSKSEKTAVATNGGKTNVITPRQKGAPRYVVADNGERG